MRKSSAVISTLLVLNLLTLPQFAAMAAEAKSIRARVISSDLSNVFDDEGSSTELHTIVIINDIELPAPIAESLTKNEQIASLSLPSSDLEEGSSQEEIAAMQDLISKQRSESRSRYIEQILHLPRNTSNCMNKFILMSKNKKKHLLHQWQISPQP